MREESEIETQKRIFSLISNNPGLHSRKISIILKISGQLADYHLQYLEKKNLIYSVKEAGYRRFYIQGRIGQEDRKRLSMLRQEVPLKIILFLIKNPGSKHKDILRLIEIAPSTLTYHIKKLVESEIIEIKSRNDIRKYYIKNVNEIINLLVQFKPYSWIDNFSDIWADFTW